MEQISAYRTCGDHPSWTPEEAPRNKKHERRTTKEAPRKRRKRLRFTQRSTGIKPMTNCRGTVSRSPQFAPQFSEFPVLKLVSIIAFDLLSAEIRALMARTVWAVSLEWGPMECGLSKNHLSNFSWMLRTVSLCFYGKISLAKSFYQRLCLRFGTCLVARRNCTVLRMQNDSIETTHTGEVHSKYTWSSSFQNLVLNNTQNVQDMQDTEQFITNKKWDSDSGDSEWQSNSQQSAWF